MKPGTTSIDAQAAGLRFSPPVRGFGTSRISSRFGVRGDPRTGGKELHQGVDIRADHGDVALAAEAGTVLFAGRQRGFGKVVIIDHGNRVHTVYGHLSELLTAEKSRVQRGTVIGRIGRSGNATGVHLHFEIRIKGRAVNPMDFL